MTTYRVTYFYLATGMEGQAADERDFGLVDAETPTEAIDKVVMAEYPEDKMYGPNNSYSTREFFRGCLSAKAIDAN